MLELVGGDRYTRVAADRELNHAPNRRDRQGLRQWVSACIPPGSDGTAGPGMVGCPQGRERLSEVRSAAVCALRGNVNLRTGDYAGPGPGAAEIVAWRSKRLRRAVSDTRLAEQLPRGGAVDLPALIGLVEGGCPPP